MFSARPAAVPLLALASFRPRPQSAAVRAQQFALACGVLDDGPIAWAGDFNHRD